MKKVKILRIIARLNIGGPAIHTILLTEGLNKEAFESLLACGSLGEGEGDMLYYADKKNVKPYFIPELGRRLNVLNDLAAFWKIFLLVRKEQPDIIHTHTAKAGTLGRLAGILHNLISFRKKIKLVHTFHGHVFGGYFGSFKTKVYVLIEKILAYFTCVIITVSPKVKEELIALGVTRKDKIKVILLGFELDDFLNIKAKEGGIVKIGIIGRLVPIKNHRLFLDAADKMIKDNPLLKVRFGIIGDGELRQSLEAYVLGLGISGYVDFLGWQKDLTKVYSDLDIVALTSLNEGTPVSLIEAMASGRPVIATDVGGVKDLLGEAENSGVQEGANFRILERGVIIKSCDVNGFAQGLAFLAKDGAIRKKQGEAGRIFARGAFGKERLVRDIESLYLEIAAIK